MSRHWWSSTSALTVVLALASCRADNSDRPAAGVFVSKHLGIELTMPDGWMSRAAGDRTIEQPDGRERGAELYSGDASDPTTAMSVRLTDPSPGAPSFALMSEDLMLASARGGAANLARSGGGDVAGCEVVYLAERMTGRCTGSAKPAGKSLRVYFSRTRSREAAERCREKPSAPGWRSQRRRAQRGARVRGGGKRSRQPPGPGVDLGPRRLRLPDAADPAGACFFALGKYLASVVVLHPADADVAELDRIVESVHLRDRG